MYRVICRPTFSPTLTWRDLSTKGQDVSPWYLSLSKVAGKESLEVVTVRREVIGLSIVCLPRYTVSDENRDAYKIQYIKSVVEIPIYDVIKQPRFYV